jgi:flagellar basal body rod protein FlgB
LLSLTTFCLVLGAVWAQNTGDTGTGPQLPVGQTFKQFEYPGYQDGKLKFTLYADEARGITLNRAETTDLKIQDYENGVVTTTVTSPKADLYVAEQKMRTKNTVLIDRSDMSAASQNCDFDLKTKKYVLRTNVKVILKHFDMSLTPGTNAAAPGSSASAPGAAVAPASPAPVHPTRSDDSLLTSPGSVSDTNSAPVSPSSPETK